jgi:hypothetical protein
MVNIGNYDLSGIVRTISYWHKGSAAQWRRGIMFIFLLAQRACYFLCLDTKKVTKERSRLQIILGLLFFSLPTQYNSLISFAQTVLLT